MVGGEKEGQGEEGRRLGFCLSGFMTLFPASASSQLGFDAFLLLRLPSTTLFIVPRLAPYPTGAVVREYGLGPGELNVARLSVRSVLLGDC